MRDHACDLKGTAACFVLSMATMAGCSVPGSQDQTTSGTEAASTFSRTTQVGPEFFDKPEFRSRDPNPSHSIYDGLAPAVRHALLELNSSDKVEVYLYENPHLCGSLRPSGESAGRICMRKDSLRQLGAEVEWNIETLLYRVRP